MALCYWLTLALVRNDMLRSDVFGGFALYYDWVGLIVRVDLCLLSAHYVI
jgi:hypothetical protein